MTNERFQHKRCSQFWHSDNFSALGVQDIESHLHTIVGDKVALEHEKAKEA